MLTLQDNMDEVHELYDIHLAHTALALLRQSDPGTRDTTLVTGRAASAMIEQMFKQWPDLPERVTQDHPLLSERGQQNPVTSVVARNALVSRNVQYGQTLRYQIWRSDGHLAFQSVNAPDTPMTEMLGFSDSKDTQGTVWRHYSIWNRSHELRAVVSEANDLRTQLVRSIAIRSIDPIVLGMPVFILLLWLSVRSGLVPLTKLGREIAMRQPSSLALLDESSTQRELRPIVSALNDLLRRIEHALENQRRFNANAAHELGTPLAAIQAHLYVAHHAEDDKERQLALNQAQLCVERGIRLVSQMLTLSRLDPQQALPDMANINLGQIAQNVCAELAPIALQRSQNLELVATPEPMFLDGNADLLHRLIGNLVDNAIRYTPAGGHISVQVCQVPTGLRLTVNDDGPGIPTDQLDQVFNRFYRLADQSSNGSGLGLAICRSIANLHHAQISLSQGSNGRGLAARVDFIQAVE